MLRSTEHLNVGEHYYLLFPTSQKAFEEKLQKRREEDYQQKKAAQDERMVDVRAKLQKDREARAAAEAIKKKEREERNRQIREGMSFPVSTPQACLTNYSLCSYPQRQKGVRRKKPNCSVKEKPQKH